jgi:hypothetical protein
MVTVEYCNRIDGVEDCLPRKMWDKKPRLNSVRHSLPMRVLTMWPSAEFDGFMACAERDVEPGQERMDI